jgi:hypothetical protein
LPPPHQPQLARERTAIHEDRDRQRHQQRRCDSAGEPGPPHGGIVVGSLVHRQSLVRRTPDVDSAAFTGRRARSSRLGLLNPR